MRNLILTFVAISTIIVPLTAFADTHSERLIPLYKQLVQVLEKELLVYSDAGRHATLSIEHATGTAPYAARFAVVNPSGTEAIDFGDGLATGSRGCPRNIFNACDLSQPITHTYSFPGTYTVTLYSNLASSTQLLSTTSLVIVRP